MKLNALLLACAGFLLLHVPAASAEDSDPAIFSNGANCIGATWCESTNLSATDPVSGDTGLVEYIFKTAAQGSSDPSVVTGDLDMSDGYVLRFEMNGATPELFLLTGAVTPYNTSNGAEANPSSWTAAAPNTISATFTPTSGQVGYDSVPGHTSQGYGSS